MRTGVPCNENRFFPVLALFWPCTGLQCKAKQFRFLLAKTQLTSDTLALRYNIANLAYVSREKSCEGKIECLIGNYLNQLCSCWQVVVCR